MSASLLEKQSTGGAIARVGFEYQDAFVLRNLPLWLSQSAFSHIVCESLSDIEVCYFSSEKSLHVMYEAKNHSLNATEFWSEIRRFKSLFDTHQKDFIWFNLVCPSYNTVITPLISKIDRLRGVGFSYDKDSSVLVNGRSEYLDWCRGKDFDLSLAEFALDYVGFITFNSEDSESIFLSEIQDTLNIELFRNQVKYLKDQFKNLISSSSSHPIYRKDFESHICLALEDDKCQWLSQPIRINLCNSSSYHNLNLNISDFSGSNRAHRTTKDWNNLIKKAISIGDFIHNSGERRTVFIDGKQRMSTACMLGYVFSATRNFLLEIEHNSITYRTDNHQQKDGTFFNKRESYEQQGETEAIMTIGFPTSIGKDIESTSLGVKGLPRLNLESTNVIDSIETLNLAVRDAKSALVSFKSNNQLSKLHLFIKAPSLFAMVLGHRLNGICDIQLYDWIDGQYIPTVILQS